MSYHYDEQQTLRAFIAITRLDKPIGILLLLADLNRFVASE